MKQGTSIVVAVLSVAAVAAFCFTTVTSADTPVSQPPFKPVASVGSLMGGQGMVFRRLQKAVTNRNTEHRYEAIEVLSEVLAELSNVNQYHAKKDDYAGWARQLRDEALALGKEAKKGSSAKDNVMRKSLRTLKSTCNSCHDVYRKDD